MLQRVVVGSLNIPERVFASEFRDVFVMDFAWLIDCRIVSLVKMLMGSEHSDMVVISKLSALDEETSAPENDTFPIDLSTTEDSYTSFLRRNWHEAAQKFAPPGLKRPWMVFARTLAACSEKGSWCLYGDRYAEIALLAFRSDSNPFLTKRLMAEYKCVRLGFALENNWLGLGRPVNEHHRHFCESLRKSYIGAL